MKIRIFSIFLLTLVGSNAGVASVLSENGDSGTAAMIGMETNAGTITLKARVSGSASQELLGEKPEKNDTGSLITDHLMQVPIPAAAWLFASALIGLVVVSRRRDPIDRPET